MKTSHSVLFLSAGVALVTSVAITQTWYRGATAQVRSGPYLETRSSARLSSRAAVSSVVAHFDQQSSRAASAGARSSSRSLSLPSDRSQRMFVLVKRHLLISDTKAFVADIKNAAGLRTKYPAVYALAQDGDVLVATKTRIIIYRPTLDILVDVMPADNTAITGAAATIPRTSSRPAR